MGGLRIFNPAAAASFSYSQALCLPLVSLVLKQAEFFDPSELRADQNNVRALQDLDMDYNYELRVKQLIPKLSPEMQKGVELARQKGASSWVTAMPSEEHGSVLHKGDFVDAIYMRYGWPILSLPLQCACGALFSVEHSLDCKLGGYRTLQHNEVRDLFAECLREGKFQGVETEPILQPLSGESFKFKSANKDDDARSDVKCLGFWRKMRQAYFDVKVVSPLARSYVSRSQQSIYREAEKSKMRAYKARIIEVEHGDFTPLVFTTTGGMGPQCERALKQLTERIAEKRELPMSVVAGWLRCRFSFALLRTSLICLRGTRRKKVVSKPNVELAVHEARMDF